MPGMDDATRVIVTGDQTADVITVGIQGPAGASANYDDSQGPRSVGTSAASPGSSIAAARRDHKHQIDLTELDARYNRRSQNLADVANPSQARSNIGAAAADDLTGLATEFYVDEANAAQDVAIAAKADTANLTAHTSRTDNPHATTKAQVGLGNADNTSDASKPVSTAQAAAIQAEADARVAADSANSAATAAKYTKPSTGVPKADLASDVQASLGLADAALPAAQKGAAGGVASLDGSGKVPSAQLPAFVDDVLEFANLAGFPATGSNGVIYVALDTNVTYRWSGSAYIEISPSQVTSVAGRSGAVTLNKADVGLSNAENTSDASKPVSTAQAAALAAKAPLASPAFTGVPTAPTASAGSNSTQLATTAYADAAAAAGSPDATSSTKGRVQLAGELGGPGSTAAAPVLRNIARVFNVKDYGAVGDGSTNDISAITSAISAASSAGGGKVFFPAGSYYISTPVTPANYVVLEGAGIDVSIIKPSTTNTGGNGDGIRAVTSSLPYYTNITVRDLTVDCSATYPTLQLGSEPSTYSNGMTFQGVDNLLVERVKVIKPAGYGIQVSSPGGNTTYIKRPVLREIFIEGERGGYDSVGGGGVLEGTIDGLYVYPSSDGINPYGTAQDWTNLRNTTIRRVRAFTTFVYGIYATTTPALPPGATRLVNPYSYPVTITFPTNSSSLTNITINEISQTLGLSSYTLPGFGTISISYNPPVPTWQWAAPAVPSFPASGIAVTNPFPYQIPVTLTGGTVSAVAINGVTQGTTTGYFLLPVGATFSMTYSSAPTWAWSQYDTVHPSSGIETDFGAVNVLYDDIYINGFYNGILISKPVNRPYPSNVTINNLRTFNTAYHGVKTNVFTGYGIAGLRLTNSNIDAYGMVGSASGVTMNGTTGFDISNNKFGVYGNASYAVILQDDGSNKCDYGTVTRNDVHSTPSYQIFTNAGAGIGASVFIGNNPGYGDAYALASDVATKSTKGYAIAMAIAL